MEEGGSVWNHQAVGAETGRLGILGRLRLTRYLVSAIGFISSSNRMGKEAETIVSIVQSCGMECSQGVVVVASASSSPWTTVPSGARDSLKVMNERSWKWNESN